MLILYSDMQQATNDLNLRQVEASGADELVESAKQKHLLTNLHGADVYVLGSGSRQSRIGETLQLRGFWTSYFAAARANLRQYWLMREAARISTTVKTVESSVKPIIPIISFLSLTRIEGLIRFRQLSVGLELSHQPKKNASGLSSAFPGGSLKDNNLGGLDAP